MMQDADPVGSGFVASLARPGGNITGLSTLAPELSGKRLELLKEIIPKLSRVAVFGTSTQPGNAQMLGEVELAAKAFGVKLHYLDVLSSKDIATAFQAASKGHADAVLMLLAGRVAISQRTEIAELAVKNRLPVIYEREIYVEAGGAYELRRELERLVQARRYVCGQDFERQNARGSARRATDEVRVHRQPEGGEADRSDGSAECAGKSG
jgi:hypothetical protein